MEMMKKRAKESFSSKKRRSTFPDWSSLQSDCLMNIFENLKVSEIHGMKGVCRSWRFTAQSLIKSKLPKYPILLLPDAEQNESNFIINLKDDLFFPIQLKRSRCLGSSKGWLLLQDFQTLDLTLWSPILDVIIHLPCASSLPRGTKTCLSPPIAKAVLCDSNPLVCSRYGVVIIVENGKGTLAFAMAGNSRWSVVEDAKEYYTDLTCHNDLVIAISHVGGVEAWDFTTLSPVKKMKVEPDFPKHIPEFIEPLCEYYRSNFYVIKSEHEILLVVRCIGRYVDSNGKLLNEDDLHERSNEIEVYPYQTRKLYVYKFDPHKKKWIFTKDLGNQVLFVGENESRTCPIEHMPMFQKNSIYFTDDLSNVMDEDEYFGGHDMGIFCLEDENIKRISRDDFKMKPAFWVVPC